MVDEHVSPPIPFSWATMPLAVLGVLALGCGDDTELPGGTKVWTHTLELSSPKIAVDGDDNVLVAFDDGLQELSSRGEEIWTVQINGDAPIHVHAVAADSDGNLVVGGDHEPQPDADYPRDIWVSKHDPEGEELWTRTYDSGTSDRVAGVAVDEDGNVVAVGGIAWSAEESANQDAWTRKYDADGAELWTQIHDSGELDRGHGVALAPNGDVIVVGTSSGPEDSPPPGPGWIIRYDPSGNELWTVFIDAQPGDVAIDPDDNIILCGRDSDSPDEIWTAKLDSEGTELWARTSESSANWADAVAADAAGNVALIGGSASDAWITKLDPTGVELWTVAPDFVDSTASDVAFDSRGNVLASGNYFTDSYNRGSWVTKHAR